MTDWFLTHKKKAHSNQVIFTHGNYYSMISIFLLFDKKSSIFFIKIDVLYSMEQVKNTIKSSNGKANGAPPALLVLVGSIPTPKFFYVKL